MKVFNFKFITTALFLLLTLFAAGFASQAAQTDAAAQKAEPAYVETFRAQTVSECPDILLMSDTAID